MIDRAVSLVALRLNQHLRQRFGSADDLVALTNLTDVEGKPAAAARNRLVMFVTNLSEENAARRVPQRRSSTDGRLGGTAETVHLNVHLMLASNFDPENYLESLKILSHGVQFFQSTPLFDHRSAPEMDAGLSQLALEIQNLDSETAAQLWGTHGGRYVPSVLYKMRLVAIASGALEREDFVIRTPESTARPVPETAP